MLIKNFYLLFLLTILPISNLLAEEYDVFYAVSDNKWNYRDLSRAKEILGYVPQDTADDKMFIK